MKKTTLILIALISVALLLVSCMRPKEPEGKKAVQGKKEEVHTPEISTESKTKLQEQLPVKSQPYEIKDSPLTEEEQKLVDEIGEIIIIAPTDYFSSQENAIEYLKILLKGDHRNIKLYKGYEDLSEDKRRRDYDEAVSKAIRSLFPDTNEEFELIIEVLKTKREYSEAIIAAVRKIYPAKDKRFIPLLRELLNIQNAYVRLEVANSLLVLGETDTALEVFDQLAREGTFNAIYELWWHLDEKIGVNEEWGPKGIDILRKALSYESNHVRAKAAYYLIKLSKWRVINGVIRKPIKQDLKELEDLILEIGNELVEKDKWDKEYLGYNGRRTAGTLIGSISQLESVRAIPLLKRISEHPEASYEQDDAEALMKRLIKLKTEQGYEPEKLSKHEKPEGVVHQTEIENTVRVGELVDLKIKVTNLNDKFAATIVIVYIYDPDMELKDSREFTVQLKPLDSMYLKFQYQTYPTYPEGIWHTGYELKVEEFDYIFDDSGNYIKKIPYKSRIDKWKEAEDGRFIVAR